MPIILPSDLPACRTLAREGIKVLQEQESRHLPLRPASTPAVRIGLLNLMPNKETTEEHFARVLGQSEQTVELVLLRLDVRDSKRTCPDYLQKFYTPWHEAKNLSGIIVTGAPVEHLPFEEVDYWHELKNVFDWLTDAKLPSLFICWAAQAALYHRHGVQKQGLELKKLGLYPHRLEAADALVHGLKDGFEVPVARHTEVPKAALAALEQVRILAESDAAGVFIAREITQPHYYAFNHLEYTADTIVEEYFREVKAGVNQPVPHCYFPNDDTTRMPERRWAASAAQFYGNWVNLCAQPASYHQPQNIFFERKSHDNSLSNAFDDLGLPAHRRTA